MAVLALALAATAARADEAREQQARQLYLEGKKAYDAQDYGRAIEMFKRAYRTLPNPALLYNISSAQQGLEQPHEAAETLRAYLRAVPDDPDRAAIEARIRALEESQRLLDQERAAVGRAPQPPTQTQTPTRTHAQTPAPMQTQTPPEPASAPGAAPATASTHAVPAPASPPQTQPAARRRRRG